MRRAYGVRGTDPRYFPPGYSQSLIWWKFDSTSTTNFIADYSAAGTNTAFVFGIGTNWSFTNNCMTVDPKLDASGTGNYAFPISQGNYCVPYMTNFTISIWVRPTTFTATNDGPWLLWGRSEAVYGAGPSAERIYPWPKYDISRCEANGSYVDFGIWNKTAVWQNITLVRSGANTMKLYKNGVPATASSSLGFGYSGTSKSTKICAGASWSSGSPSLANNGELTLGGQIDDFYITSYPFTAADATNHYLQGRSQ